MKIWQKGVVVAGVAVTLLATALSAASDASAQQLCLVRDDAVAQLGKLYGEAVTGRGIAQDGQAMVEILTSAQGSWTLVVTDVNGRSCVVAAGEAWQAIKPLRGSIS